MGPLNFSSGHDLGAVFAPGWEHFESFDRTKVGWQPDVVQKLSARGLPGQADRIETPGVLIRKIEARLVKTALFFAWKSKLGLQKSW